MLPAASFVTLRVMLAVPVPPASGSGGTMGGVSAAVVSCAMNFTWVVLLPGTGLGLGLPVELDPDPQPATKIASAAATPAGAVLMGLLPWRVRFAGIKRTFWTG